jgi:DNA polymerase-4
MRHYGLICDTVKLGIKDTALRSTERQIKLAYPNRTAASLFEGAFSLLKANRFNEIPLRSIGVCACGISEETSTQLSFSPEFIRLQRQEILESTTDSIKTQYGFASIQRGVMFTEKDLSINFAVNRTSFGSDARINV